MVSVQIGRIKWEVEGAMARLSFLHLGSERDGYGPRHKRERLR